MIIEVKQEHINVGLKSNCKLCPLALAIKEKTGLETAVGVTIAEIEHAGKYTRYDLPRQAINFIRDFDCSREVYPFFFTLKEQDENFWTRR